MTSTGQDAARQEDGASGRKSYRPSRVLFFVMLAVIVGAVVLFIVIGPLKGGGVSGASGSSKTNTAPSSQR